MRLPDWLRLHPHGKPEPGRHSRVAPDTIAQRPTDVRLIDVHGTEFPVEIAYTGPDEAGVHMWEVVGGLPKGGEWAPPAPRLYVGVLPAMSAITFPAVRYGATIE